MNYLQDIFLTEEEKLLFSPVKSKVPLFWAWFLGILFCWALFVPLVLAIRYHILFKNTEYAITEKRLLKKEGWLKVTCAQIKVEEIDSVSMSKSFWSAINKYGKVFIQSTDGEKLVFKNVKEPEKVLKAINTAAPIDL
ncbi:MAG: PH domain-containing protein [Clostridia bacterium]|nr:PH domain-containing protein [Clostridia bacterium]